MGVPVDLGLGSASVSTTADYPLQQNEQKQKGWQSTRTQVGTTLHSITTLSQGRRVGVEEELTGVRRHEAKLSCREETVTNQRADPQPVVERLVAVAGRMRRILEESLRSQTRVQKCQG